MQSNTRTYPGLNMYHDSRFAPSVLSNTGGERAFVVTNGLAQGDHKSPNAIRFTVDEVYTPSNKRILQVRPEYGGYKQQWYGHDPNCNPLGQGTAGLTTLYAEPYAALYDRAFAKIFDQLRGNSEIIVDTIEGASTLRMLKGATRLLSGVGSVLSWIAQDISKSGHRGQRALDYATGKWLEYSYGWKPLVNSVYDAFDNLSRVRASEVQRIVARAGNRRETNQVLSLSQSSYGPYKVNQHVINRDRIILCYEFHVGGMSTVGDWTSLNPATIAWELLPFSFVADWFVSVGDSLRNLENWWLYRSRFLRGYDTHTALCYVERSLSGAKTFDSGPAYNAGYISEIVEGNMWMNRRYKDRVVRTSLPVPRGPRFRVKLGADKCLSAAALLQQLVGRRSREWSS